MVSVIASGLVTSVGFNGQASCAAMRARIRQVGVTNLWDAQSGDYLAAGRVQLPHWWVGVGKLAELVAPAIEECVRAADPVPPTEIPILLCVPAAQRPCALPGLEQQIWAELQHKLSFEICPESRLISRDRVSVVPGLREADRLLAQSGFRCCVVAGVDSLLQQDLVEHYLRQRRLLPTKNSNGFSPGEAGRAVLVAPAGARPPAGTSVVLEILGTGAGQESATIESDDPLRGDGLAQAISSAMRQAGVTIHDLHYRISDLNGEHYRFKEMVFAMMRFERKPKPKLFDLWHPIEYIGDVGAAIGPTVLAVALHAAQKGYGVGPNVLCTFGSDDGARAAIVARAAAA
jgi:3-oxoacyl-[acyl-carrier-protein] synthase-1